MPSLPTSLTVVPEIDTVLWLPKAMPSAKRTSLTEVLLIATVLR